MELDTQVEFVETVRADMGIIRLGTVGRLVYEDGVNAWVEVNEIESNWTREFPLEQKVPLDSLRPYVDHSPITLDLPGGEYPVQFPCLTCGGTLYGIGYCRTCDAPH